VFPKKALSTDQNVLTRNGFRCYVLFAPLRTRTCKGEKIIVCALKKVSIWRQNF